MTTEAARASASSAPKASHGRSPPSTAMGCTRPGNPSVNVARLVASACVGVGTVIAPPSMPRYSLSIDCR